MLWSEPTRPDFMCFKLCPVTVSVPQVLALMVDLEEEPDWPTADEIEEEDNDRSVFQHIEAETKWPPFCRRHIQCIYFNENGCISINVSVKFVPKGQISNIPALVQIMAWRRPGDKPLSEPVMISLLTHICVTRPQWVNSLAFGTFEWNCLKFSNFQTNFSDFWLRYLLWNCPQMNLTGPHLLQCWPRYMSPHGITWLIGNSCTDLTLWPWPLHKTS